MAQRLHDTLLKYTLDFFMVGQW